MHPTQTYFLNPGQITQNRLKEVRRPFFLWEAPVFFFFFDKGAIWDFLKTHGALKYLLILGLAMGFNQTLLAQRSWDGGGAADNWGDPLNWSGDVLPTSTDAVTIATGSTFTVTVDINNAVCQSLALGATGNAINTLSFNANTQLTVGGIVTLGNSGNTNRRGSITMSSGGTLICQGFALAIAASAGTFTPGTGTVELTATNTLPASLVTSFNNLIISGGTTTLGVNLNSTAAGTIDVRSGATLALSSFTYGATTAPAGITMECGATSAATISSTTGTLTLGGSVTINDNGGGTTGAVISTKLASTSVRTFTVADDGTSAADLTLSAAYSGTGGGINKSGAGTLSISVANSYTGGTTINAGVVTVSNASAFGTAARSLTMTGGTLDLALNSTINAHPTTINGTATINSNRSDLGAGVAHTLGTLSIGASDQLNITTGANVNSDTARLTFGATTLSAATPVFDVASGALLTLGAISGAFAFNRQGAGTMALNTASSRTGGSIAISAGTTRIGIVSALGTTGVSITMTGGTLELATNSSVNAYPTTIDGNATIIANRAAAGAGITHTLGTLSIGASDQLNLTAGANVTSDTARLTFGATTLSAATPVFDVGTGAMLTLGALSGAFAFNKDDAGLLTLNTASSRTGGTVTINAGTLRLGIVNGLGTTGVSLVMAGGTLNLATNTSVNAYPITISGNATISPNRAATGAGVTHTLGTLSMGSQTLAVSGGNMVTSGTAQLTFGVVTLSGDPVYNVTNPSGGGATILSLPQALSASTSSLTKQGNGALNFGSTAVSLNDLTVSAGTLLSTSNTLTLAGDFSNSGTFTHNSGTVVMGGTTQSIGGTTNPTTFNTLTINNGSTTTLLQNLQCVTTMNVNSGGILDLSTFTANRTAASGTLTVAGELRLGSNTGGQGNSNYPSNYSTHTLTGGTVVYNRAAGGQTIFATPNYNNLTISNTSNATTAGAALTVNGVLTTSTSDALLDMSTFQLLGTLTSVSNSGTIQTSNTTNPAIPANKNWGGTVIYAAGTGGQSIPSGTFATLTQQNTSSTNTLVGDVTVSNAFNFAATGSGKLALGANTLTLGGTIANMDASRCFTANGSTSSITLNGSGVLGTNLFLDQTTPGTTNKLNNLTYNRTGVTFTLGDTVEIKGMVTPTAGLLLTAKKLKLISDASGDAGILAGSGLYIADTVTVQRYIPSSGRRWRFLASPCSGATLADWQVMTHITGTGGASNGFDATLSNFSSVYSYNEPTVGDLNQGWITATHISNALTPGKGFRVFIRGDRSPARLNGTDNTQNAITLRIINAVTSGDVNMLPTFSAPGASDDGWNLMGNPYPCAIDWNAFHDAGRSFVTPPDYSGTDYQHLDAVVYVLDPGGASTSYASYNALSGALVGDLSGGIIPSGASFWVKAVASSPSMTMKEIYKTNTAAGSIFKTAADNIQFSIKVLSNGLVGDETVVKYVAGATSGFDAYDIAKMYGEDINIASIGTDGSYLAANYKPFNGHSDTIPLSLGFSNSGDYKMVFNDPATLDLNQNQSVFLVDIFNQSIIDLKETNEYAFQVDKGNANTFGNNRFMLVVGDLPTGFPEFERSAGASKLYLYPAITQGKATVYSNHHTTGEVEVCVTDLSGKRLSTTMMKWENDQLSVDMSSYQTGLYIISVKQGSEAVTTLRCIKE
jgi:autotransporter-associated beta strand protein